MVEGRGFTPAGPAEWHSRILHPFHYHRCHRRTIGYHCAPIALPSLTSALPLATGALPWATIALPSVTIALLSVNFLCQRWEGTESAQKHDGTRGRGGGVRKPGQRGGKRNPCPSMFYKRGWERGFWDPKM